MLKLSARIRDPKKGQKNDALLSVLYGHKIKNTALEINKSEFEKIYNQAGESTLISLEIEGKTKHLVLIQDISHDPLTLKIIHVDFYQPNLEEEVSKEIPIILEGDAPAVKELGGTLVKNISEVEVKALPQDLPYEIKVDVSVLKTFDDTITIGSLLSSDKVKIVGDPEEIIALVTPPEKVEEELAKPIEENIEEVEKVEEKTEETEE